MKNNLSKFYNEKLPGLKKSLFNFSDFFMALGMTVLMTLLLFFSNHFRTHLQKDFIGSNILFIIVMMVFLFLVYLFKSRMKINVNFDKIVKYSIIMLFIVQLYIFYNIFFETGWDASVVRGISRAVANNENPGDPFGAYPNLMLITSLAALIFKLNNTLGVFFGTHASFCLVIVNCLISSYASYLTYGVIKKLFNKKYAFMGYLFFVGLVIFSPWNVIFYSDAVGLMFPVLILYIYLNEKLNFYFKYTLMFTLCYIAYVIKPQCVIMIIAILLCFIIKNIGFINKKFIKKSLIVLVCSVIAVLSVGKGITSLNESNNFVVNEDKKIGMTHFLMMGLNYETKGVYSGDDVAFSNSFSTSDERTKANLNEAKSRVKELGLRGIGSLVCHKALINFNDGTFAWGGEGNFYAILYGDVNSTVSPFLKNIYYSQSGAESNENFKYYASFTQFIWINVLFLILIKALKQFLSKYKYRNRNREIDFNYQIIVLALFGLTLFELIFEARARYLYTYIPIFIIAAMYGLKELNCGFRSIKTRFLRTKNKGHSEKLF